MQVEKRAGYGTGVLVDFRDQESLTELRRESPSLNAT